MVQAEAQCAFLAEVWPKCGQSHLWFRGTWSCKHHQKAKCIQEWRKFKRATKSPGPLGGCSCIRWFGCLGFRCPFWGPNMDQSVMNSLNEHEGPSRWEGTRFIDILIFIGWDVVLNWFTLYVKLPSLICEKVDLSSPLCEGWTRCHSCLGEVYRRMFSEDQCLPLHCTRTVHGICLW